MTGTGLEVLPPLREVIRKYGLTARKSLGQHFLLDLNLTARIARAAGDLSGQPVLEVGSGPGGLTRALLAAGAGHVFAVERDSRCLAALEELAEAMPGRLTVLEADALVLNEAEHMPMPISVVANLPYNISTALLVKWLRRPERFVQLTLMFQKEVAERLVASPRSKAYGRLSIVAQWRADVASLFDVDPRAFTPPPKVRSTVVRVTPRPEPLAPADADDLERVVAGAFGQRRKMLRSSLRQLSRNPEAWLAAAQISATARAEELGIDDFCRLARTWAGHR